MPDPTPLDRLASYSLVHRIEGTKAELDSIDRQISEHHNQMVALHERRIATLDRDRAFRAELARRMEAAQVELLIYGATWEHKAFRLFADCHSVQSVRVGDTMDLDDAVKLSVSPPPVADGENPDEATNPNTRRLAIDDDDDEPDRPLVAEAVVAALAPSDDEPSCSCPPGEPCAFAGATLGESPAAFEGRMAAEYEQILEHQMAGGD